MSDALKLALTITATDLASGALRRFRDRITGAGEAAKKVQKDYDLMVTSVNRGVKALAVDRYLVAKIRPGVRAAADLQESLLNVKQLLWSSGEGAGALSKKLSEVRRTAVDVSANLPFSATDLSNIEGNLLQGGVSLKAILGKHGAAFATAALSAISGDSPQAVSVDLAKIGHAFQLKNGQYAQLANNLAKISSSSAATLPELMYNLKQAGPAAHALGISGKDTGIALAATASLGEEAGSDLKQFYIGLAGASRFGRKARRILGVNFFDTKGKFVGQEEALRRLRVGLSRFHSQQERMILLQRVFQTQGAQAARLLLQTGNKSYEDIKKKSEHSAGLIEREKIWAEGLNAAVAKLGGTTQSTLANLFNPMLKPLNEAVNKTNSLVSNVGDLAGKHKDFSRAFSYGTVGVAGLIGLYGAGQILRGGAAGMRVLKGLKGLGGAAAGIAEGKAVEAATGVAPVFVTNWPATIGAGNKLERDVLRSEAPSLIRKALPLLGAAGVYGLTAAGIIGTGAFLSHEANKHGWASRTYGPGSRQYEVMGIGYAPHRSRRDFSDFDLKGALSSGRQPQAAPVHGEVTVRVKADRGLKAKAERPKSDSPALDLATETEVGDAGGAL